jgi:hypothetical protein
MGQNFSLPLLPMVDPHDTRPTSLVECEDGYWELDRDKFRLFDEREDDEMDAALANLLYII